MQKWFIGTMILALFIAAGCGNGGKLGSFASEKNDKKTENPPLAPEKPTSCNVNDDCPPGSRCQAGYCISNCNDPRYTCPKGSSCRADGYCISNCNVDPTVCPKGSYCRADGYCIASLSQTTEYRSTKSCASLGGSPCGGCCKENITAADVETCCKQGSCVQRIQQKKTFSEIGEVTIELFANGEIGVFYGQETIAGKPNYAKASKTGNNEYIFGAEEKHHTFTAEIKNCELIVS